MLATALDAALEVMVAPSFTRIGYEVRARAERWRPIASTDLAGRVVLLTGGTSGIGRAAAQRFASLGADLIVVGRDRCRLTELQTRLAPVAEAHGARVQTLVADLGDLRAVRAAADQVMVERDELHVLVHNAGALSRVRTELGGVESTVAAQVLGPFLLTSLLFPLLKRTGSARVVTMASGGMYSSRLYAADLEMEPRTYRGSEQYARAKRAQVTLNEQWAERTAGQGIVFHALHPGWVDTPGVRSALPRFHRMLRPLLRTPEQGADTLVWLAADDGKPLSTSGAFWHDRRVRPIHLPYARTRASDTPAARGALWNWCVARTGAVPPDMTRDPDMNRNAPRTGPPCA